MPFDPSLPTTHSANSSAEMRAQLNALNDRITAQEAVITALTGQFAALQLTVELALADTPHNVGQGTLDIFPLDDPPTRPQFQQFLAAYNALLNQITRV